MHSVCFVRLYIMKAEYVYFSSKRAVITMTGTEYAALLARSPHGAHRALFDEYYNYVYTVVCGRLAGAPREDVEECVSDTFASLYMELEKGSFDGELRGVVGVIAKRRAIDRYRSAFARRPGVVSLDDESSAQLPSGDNTEESVENELLRAQLIGAVERLGEPDSTILIQRYFFGCRFGEIAKQLSMSAPAVRMRCSRALRRLKMILTENETEL